MHQFVGGHSAAGLRAPCCVRSGEAARGWEPRARAPRWLLASWPGQRLLTGGRRLALSLTCVFAVAL